MCMECRDELRTAVHKGQRRWSSDPRESADVLTDTQSVPRLAAARRMPTEHKQASL